MVLRKEPSCQPVKSAKAKLEQQEQPAAEEEIKQHLRDVAENTQAALGKLATISQHLEPPDSSN